MYDIEIIIERADGRTELRGTDSESLTPHDAIARALVNVEVLDGDRGMTIKAIPHTCSVHAACQCK